MPLEADGAVVGLAGKISSRGVIHMTNDAVWATLHGATLLALFFISMLRSTNLTA